MTLRVDVNLTGSQGGVVSNWQLAHILVDDALSRAEIAATPFLLALALSHLLMSHLIPRRKDPNWQPACSTLVFVKAQSIVL